MTEICFTGVCIPWPENQVTPSCTMSYRSLYVPGVAGTATCALTAAMTVRAVPASDVRRPSHTTTLPAASYQWYVRFTFEPQSKFDMFSIFTGTDMVTFAPIVAGV